FKNKTLDLIITDLMLEPDKPLKDPALSGIEFIKRIKSDETFKEIKVLVYSARSDDFLKNDLCPYIEKYCTKNMEDSELKQTITNILTAN
ncbi:Signal transduction response regulator, receiver region domain protein, partial [Candidatus Magnetomorum sp. HK-1]